MREFGLGRPVPRVEDARLLQGRGRYTDDITFPGQAVMYVLRSPHAAARIRSIDAAAAEAAPGVLAVLTGEDVAADGLGTLPCRVKRQRADGSAMFEPPYRLLALERVQMAGDAVAIVVAETLALAKDAAELIEVDYQPLPSVTGTKDAVQPGAATVWAEAPGNVCFVFEQGDKAAVETAFARAAHVTRLDFTISRVAASPMEPRDAIGLYDPGEERYTLYAGLQGPHLMRAELAGAVLKIPQNRLRVVSPDMGGAFGMRGSAFPELALVLWASRRVGRPVRWVAERSEGFIADHHARDNVSRAELALDKDGKFLAFRIRTIANLGAYLAVSGPHSPTNNLGSLSGVYTTPHIHAHVTGVFTNTHPTSAYRGAGRPEATFAIERTIDVAAGELGIDRAELRRRNLIPAAAMPYKTGFVFTYDSGDFAKNMDMVLRLADWAGFEARRAEAASRGRLRGIGIANAIEIAGGPFPQPFEEAAEIRFDPGGTATILLGTHSHGQGHETAFRQLANDLLGLDPDTVRVAFGDTDQVQHGRGTFGSRSMSVGGAALVRTAEKIIDKGRKIAAYLLEAAEVDMEFAAGRFRVAGTDRSIDLATVARTSFVPGKLPPGMDMGLAEAAIVAPPGATFPNGCHVCEVEIDPETGQVALLRYAVVDDVGRVVNPLLVHGQIHGGIAQGAGQALFENIVYDRESGQILSGSFMDYCMPRADDLPFFAVEGHEVLATTNPLGIKGAGEAGTVGAIPAVISAVADALQPLGIRHLDMPASPERVWRAIQAAGK